MQLIGMGWCMHVDLLTIFIRAMFQMSPWSNKRAVAVRICHDFDKLMATESRNLVTCIYRAGTSAK